MYSTAEYDTLLRANNPGFERVGVYKGMAHRIKHKCTQCETTALIRPGNLIHVRQRCGTCNPKGRAPEFTLRDFLDRTPSLYQAYVFHDDLDLASPKTVNVTCCACHRASSPSVMNLIRGKSSCVWCSKQFKTSGTHQVELDALFNNVDVLGVYKDARTHILYQCRSCEYTFSSRPVNVLHCTYPCPKCRREFNARHSNNAFQPKDYKLGNRLVKVQGYEPQALDWILANTAVRARDIEVDRNLIPAVRYLFGGKWRIHLPDFYIAKSNLLLEVKSTVTLGLQKSTICKEAPDVLYRKICAKASAALDDGYRYKLLLMREDGHRLKLPYDWYALSRDQIKAQLDGIINDHAVA